MSPASAGTSFGPSWLIFSLNANRKEKDVYREPIGRFIDQENPKLFVPKNGGLNAYVAGLLNEIGIDEHGVYHRHDGSRGQVTIDHARGEDIARRVEDGIARGEAVYGLTGDDLFDAYSRSVPDSRIGVLNTYDWFDPNAQFCRPALCFLNRDGRMPGFSTPLSVAVNLKYRPLAEDYLRHRLGSSAWETVGYAGDTENTVAEGTHDACIEIVYRGEKSSESALSRSALRIVDVLRFSDISLIGPVYVNPWREEYSRIQATVGRTDRSRTARLLEDENRICKKIGEESAEFCRAFVLNEGIPDEYNGVVYGLMVAAANRGVKWDTIEADLKARW